MHTSRRHQVRDVGLIELQPGAAAQPLGQHHGAVANTDQSADRMAYRLKHATHFAVATFRDGDAIPAIGTFTATVFNRTEAGHAVFQLNTVKQSLLFFLAQGTKDPGCVFALQTKTWVHQRIGQLTGTGEQQQAFGIQVQTTYRLPLAMLQLGQLAKHGGAVLWIIMRHHFTHRLVIGNHARRRWINAKTNRLAVHLDLITELNTLTNVSWLVVDRNTALQNELLHFKT